MEKSENRSVLAPARLRISPPPLIIKQTFSRLHVRDFAHAEPFRALSRRIVKDSFFRRPRAQEKCKITTVFECFPSFSRRDSADLPTLQENWENVRIFRFRFTRVRRTYVVILRNVERRRGKCLRKLSFHCVCTTEKHAKTNAIRLCQVWWQSFRTEIFVKQRLLSPNDFAKSGLRWT